MREGERREGERRERGREGGRVREGEGGREAEMYHGQKTWQLLYPLHQPQATHQLSGLLEYFKSAMASCVH